MKDLSNENIIHVKKDGIQYIQFKKLLELNSLNISIIINKNFIRIICRGFGSCLGLSIFGANELAKNDCTFINILFYYFNGIKICRYSK